MRSPAKALIFCIGLLIPTTQAKADFFTPISLSGVVNARLQVAHPEYPQGSGILLGDVPFDIASVGRNAWFASFAASGGAGTVSTTIPVGMSGVVGVHTLINTLWGRSGTPSLANLRFNFSDGSSFAKLLVGDEDIRDYYQNTFTNVINNTTTVRVFFTDTDGPAGPNRYRLDKQFIDLSAFSQKTLVSMTLTDSGNENFQRTVLSGVTVQTVPEPSSFVLATLGAVGVLGLARRSSTRNPRQRTTDPRVS